MNQTLRLANRTGFEWLAAMPAFLVLIFVILLNTSHATHAQLLKLGENVWDGYFLLRADPVQPSCEINGDIDAQLTRLIAENAAPAEEDEWDLFDEDPEPIDEGLLRQSLINAQAVCQTKHQTFEDTVDRITPAVRAFRAVELSVAEFGEFGLHAQRIMLAVLVLICGMTALFRRHHIALRPMETVMDYRVAASAQVLAGGILFFSVYSFKEVVFNAGVAVSAEHGFLHHLWIAGFAAFFLLSAYQFVVVPKDAKPGGSFLKAQLAVPIYASMCIISGIYFFSNGHVAGIGIYLNQMMELSQLFLNVGLYVWIGMLVKRTKMAQAVFDVFRPWNLPPEMLAVVVVLIAALPTAYTGGSGIFVIAIGGLIYNELRRAGARRQLALAATAMSGSMGVVLRPCLLVVIIAALNKEVTTDQLFGWGLNVFLLTAVIFAAIAMLTKQGTFKIEKVAVAWPETKKGLWKLVPYVILIGLTLAFYSIFLNAYLDEFSAPFILPVMLLVILVYERMGQEKMGREQMNIDHIENRLEESWKDLKNGNDSIEKTLREATTETTGHIGALLMLMGLSVSIGGVIERSHMMDLVPASFESVWLAMGLLVAILVVIGMIMEPYGAVILVSATFASIAYDSGIDPVHFWMVTLVAFELGYLSPPVALNHLLARQVVGEEEALKADEEVADGTFYQRHERVLMPMITMGTVLLIVAFGPLIVAY